ncbi:MAG: bifunctional folylpolyglutamate synthase/dihydrofolate synthase [Bacteroidetes bacterium]|nr:bifunctional folylpolyglutamate synthase/dihydrofolate synthase [Bacteroidota bacterium]MCL2303362.1 bifunctional folylpolyglutamate synthase/dihydrofolate synthase [Lentimicrobiaceae bacterium]
MTYPEIIAHIFQSFPMYHRIGSAAYKEGLENIEQLAEMAGNPEKKIKAIHIAGTNGKGSVAHLLASYFQELGWKTGLFTSPHLIDFRERIKINGKEISEQKVVDFFGKYQEKMTEISPSFFEMTTILAFDTFANEEVDIAIIETGLGGRLDATNILSPILSVITNISLDHTKMLGNSLPEIAYEKAGIIKENTPVVIGEYYPETFPVFEKMAKDKNAPLFLAEEYTDDLDFGGTYQRKNLGTFLKCVHVFENTVCGMRYEVCDEKSNKLSPSKFEGVPEGRGSLYKNIILNTIKNLQQNTNFMGRWQIISEKPLTICDVAHNSAGIAAVMTQLQNLPHQNLHIVIGFANDKDLDEITPLLPKNARYYACQAQIERAMPAEELFEKLSLAKLNVVKGFDVINTYKQAFNNSQENDIIFIGGSFFVVGEFLSTKCNHQL